MDDPIKEIGQIQEHYKTETLQKHSELNVGIERYVGGCSHST